MNTRKVIFSLVTPQDFEFDPDATEQEDRLSLEKTENRKGLFEYKRPIRSGLSR